MASGQQLAQQNVQAFVTWSASKSDEEFRAMANRGVLSRKEVANECGFSKSVLNQNLLIKPALRELEDDLRHRGILPPAVVQDPDEPQQPAMREPGRLRAAQGAPR